MTTAVLSIGSNLGNRLGYLQLAVAALEKRVAAVSAVYETDPWGTVGPNFLNAVIVASDPKLDERGWLGEAMRIEALAARTRERVWGPRTLDVDVIACTREDGTSVSVADERLTVPHPRAHERAFVLFPWLDVQPEARLSVDGWDVSVRELVDSLVLREGIVVRRTALTLSFAVSHAL
ncbi:2-amino-4-hydroxy-6-hydroxymethyldihydropteridine diphosphokinase [Segniliparus rugosus]|uniref:2-amino-4-hydroxy-6-hydroxymethyldihydropteridine diphosphokinase n=1 Tax=Segniliparus rugosus (strain ATCC BAA-974 / DSM 45345 / CCUG 50838 / CIP 108380 / JCM 13579 / CDC 945) TaxID=679197 RepID=E5XQX8_SEGRC|nr:2-amino-4-hydroxy-6-hydroxymethyldihydropteridine diphosphokinase [Segniliparus rugosus]EFV13218.1 2-amino-4-hydroxy-6-hydroxymethyldihydropteridine pyrophosphokinase [Segniliparus rugosus ATCC BAA-974]